MLNSVKINVVNEIPTVGIKEILGWLPRYLNSDVLKCGSTDLIRLNTCTVWPTNFVAQKLPPEYIN
jgi:hypothetical protein